MNQENNVSHTNNKKTPENDNIKSTPIDAKDQLTLLKQYQDFVKDANTQIDRVSKIHWTLLIILGLVIAVGISFTYKTASDFKTEVRNDVENLKKEVEKRIDDELSKKSIQDLINKKVSERVDVIADDLIGKQITEKISPKITESDSKLSDISLELNKIKDDSIKLSELNNFTLTFLKALGDDYKAFEQLGNWSADKNFAFPEISLIMYETIRLTHFQQKAMRIANILLPKEVDFSKGSFSEFTQLLDSLPWKFHANLIGKIWERKEEEISKIEKMSFLIKVLKTSNSLRAKNLAGILFEREYDVNWDPFKMQPIYYKWDEIQKTK